MDPEVDKVELAEVAVDDVALDFTDLKKKKKKKVTITEDVEPEIVDDEDMFSALKKKKKKKPTEEATQEPSLSVDGEYTYSELLARVFTMLRENNPEIQGEKKRYTIVPPQVLREGSKKTAFANVIDICKRMHRQPDHVIQFLFSELGTSGSIDGSQRLVIKGRFQQKQIENVLKRYIVEYVTCKTCRSAETQLKKENRLYFLQCESCGSSRSVSAIKTGFLAQTGKRSAARNAAG